MLMVRPIGGFRVRVSWVAAAMAGMLGLAALPAVAQPDSGAQSGVLVYQADFFANARPNTAYDMIGRLPGFTFDDGNSARGFAGTAGNVLIDGQRPTSKTDDLQSILQRIPASDVERIELIRGGARGIDMQGQTVVANVIRKKADSTKIVADVSDNLFLVDHHTIPSATVQFTQHSGDSTYEGSLSRTGNFDDSVGSGFHKVTDVTTGNVIKQNARSNGQGFGGQLTGAATVPLFGGQFKANLALQASPFNSDLFYTGGPQNQAITDKYNSNSGELGLHWEGPLGGAHLETLFLQRLGHATDLNESLEIGDVEVFHSRANTGESIARATVRYEMTPSLSFEGGGEGAFNFLDGRSSFIDNGVDIPIPGADAYVDEKRAEPFAQGTWKMSDQWTLEAGARMEYSIIAETGDVNQSRTFFYPKPRAVLTWAPDSDTQVRLRYERVLGQLDFNNFIASSNLSGTGVSGGNANLRPDQHTQYEISAERHFWDKGALVATFMHEEIKDVVDLIPVTDANGNVFDAPGNIGNGTNNQINLNLTLPFDKLGIPNGLLKVTNVFKLTNVKDPVTGRDRVISGTRPQDIEVKFTQDVDSLKSTWGVLYYNCWDEHYYRLAQVRHRRVIPPYLVAWWEYKPEDSLSLRFEVDNFGRFVYDDQFFNYAGPRDKFPLSSIEEIHIKSQPRLFFEIRKTFNG
jgi:outer membrane receptor protein involved in Fe transport